MGLCQLHLTSEQLLLAVVQSLSSLEGFLAFVKYTTVIHLVELNQRIITTVAYHIPPGHSGLENHEYDLVCHQEVKYFFANEIGVCSTQHRQI